MVRFQLDTQPNTFFVGKLALSPKVVGPPTLSAAVTVQSSLTVRSSVLVIEGAVNDVEHTMLGTFSSLSSVRMLVPVELEYFNDTLSLVFWVLALLSYNVRLGEKCDSNPEPFFSVDAIIPFVVSNII